jgi:hypothetical protein
VPQIAAVPTAIDPYKRPAARVPQIAVVPTAIDPYGCPTARAPEVPVARVVIDPHEDPKSLRLKATQEGDRMGKCFKERNEARARNEHQRAKELTQRGEAHKENMTLLDKEASAKIFQGTKSIKGTCRIQGAYLRHTENNQVCCVLSRGSVV